MLTDKSFIIHSKAKSYFWKGEGLFSLKSFGNGEAYYNVGNGNYSVGGSSYLLLNHKQDYSIIIDSDIEVESFTIFFESSLIHSIYSSLLNDTHRTLEPLDKKASVEFYVRNYPFSGIFLKTYFAFKNEYPSNKKNKFWLEEKLAIIAENIIIENFKNLPEINKISALKHSTRQELYKRLLIAKEYLYANFHTELTLEALSKVCSLAVNHLIKHFKEVFRLTPHQLLTHIRIEKSKHWLKHTNWSLPEIVAQSGFSSIPSFCSLFFKIVGTSPIKYRALHANHPS